MGTSTGRGDLHTDQFLTNMAMGYRPMGAIADMIFPVVRVPKQSDKYAIFSRQEALTVEDTKRSPGGEANKITRSVSSGAFYCENYALKIPLTLEDRENMDAAFYSQLVTGRAQYLLDKMFLDWDLRVSNMVNSTSNVGSSATVASAWSAAGNPLGNVNTGIDNVQDATGVRPNNIIFGLAAWRAFRRDSTVRNLIFGTNNGGGYPSRSQVADLLEVERVMVGESFYSSSNEAQAESISKVWDDNALIYYAPSAPTMERPSFAYTYRWSRPAIPDFSVERHPFNAKIKAEEVEVGVYQDELITGAAYSFLITGVNSSQ